MKKSQFFEGGSGRSFTAKNAKKISEHNAKNFARNSLPLPRNRQKTKLISLSYDVNDHVYSKLKYTNFEINAAFTPGGFGDQERNLTFVKTAFQV